METLDTSVRMPRFIRHRFRKPPFALQERDAEIVHLVSRNRLIDSDDICLLINGSRQVVLRRLQRLFHANFLDRPRQQLERGNCSMVYGLGQRGAELVASQTGQKVIKDYAERNRQVRVRYIEHALMVARLQTSIAYACDCSGTVAIERWLPDGAISSSVEVDDGRRTERIPIRPDAFLILRVLDATPGRIHCCLEADRGTMDLGRIETKLKGYWHFWKSGKAERQLGTRNFLVLIATSSPERAQHITERCERVASKGLRMFLVAPEQAYLPATERRVFNAIWQVPGDRRLHSMTE